jgi:hypothetical protein
VIQQTRQRFAARLAQLWPGQFIRRLLVHYIDRFTQGRVVQGKLGRFGFMQKSLPIQMVEAANTMQPRDGPIDKLWPTLADADEVATHVGPTEGQQDDPRLDLGIAL